MPVRILIFLLCLLPNLLFAKQEESKAMTEINELELFEFLSLYEKGDAVFIDSEMESKTNTVNLINQKVKMSDSDE